MPSLAWTGAVAIIVTASGVVAGQGNRPAAAGGVAASAERARFRLAVNPTAVLDRILSFDVNADNRISREELPERMERLVARADRNQDGFLTLNEIVPQIDIQPPAPRRPFSVGMHGAPTLAAIVDDLKLPPATRDRALAIVNGPRNTDQPASADFRTEMRGLLGDEDYENYTAAVDRLRHTPQIVGGNIRFRVSHGRTLARR